MKNQTWLLLLWVACIFPFLAPAQIKKCHTYESLQAFKKNNPGAQTDEQFESWLTKKIKETPLNQRMLSNYTIPVVFHIVHNGEAVGIGSNISAAKIQQQLDQLNKDFANASGSTYSVAAAANIRFELAVIDPQGRKLAEPGIERINRNSRSWIAPPYDISTYNSFADETIMPATIWSPYKYFNVWVMHLAGNYLGKATFPSASGLPDMAGSGDTDEHSGVLLHYGSVGDVSNPGPFGSSGGLGRTLTHEAGHFFGLRHIWGDAVCGTDYCDDTPAQEWLTEGCPIGMVPGNCTSGDNKMYENYMDYTFDGCVNTFTAGQVGRMQTVMQNSPRRRELAQSTVYMAPPANTVRFENVSFSFSENGINTSACPAYREVHVALNVFEAADNVSTLHFSASGTAQRGTDYELITPTITFQAGESTKTLVLRIYDDAVAETEENITLQYTISGSGVQADAENQILSINIKDNDAITAVSNTGLVTLMREDFDGNGGAGVTNAWYIASFAGHGGLNTWTFSGNGGAGFSGNSAHTTSNAATRVNNYSVSSPSDIILFTGPIDAKGKSNVTLSFNYKAGGEIGNDGSLKDFGILFYSLDGKSFQPVRDLVNNALYLFYDENGVVRFREDLGAELGGKEFYLGFRWINDNAAGSGVGFTIDDILIQSEALAVGQTAGEIGKQTVPAGQSILLKNTTSTELIAKIENAASNLGCVTATVTQAGTALQPITTNTGTYQRTQKVIQISPQNQTTATVTLYFTDAELAQWAGSKGILKVLKVADGVSLDGTLTAKDAEIITPVVTSFAAEGYTAYTFTVQSFSQFMLVSPATTLPVKLVQFEARPAGKQIELTWQTADEKENKGFWVEKSTDGIRFEQASWVNGIGAGTYKFTDRQVQPGVVYYYRLQQVDHSGGTVYSATRQARLAGAGLQVQVSPNPATDKVHVIVSGGNRPVTIRLLNAGGVVAAQWQQVNVSNAPVTIPMAHLPKGLYTVLVITEDGTHSQKIIKR